jgi:hypothetical protein
MRYDLDGKGRGLIETLSYHLPGGTEENNKKNLDHAAGVCAETQTEHFPNTSLRHSHYLPSGC